ncbi:MAG: hypothetical protein ACI3XM_08415, partial [Eubacteriales bacterium]
NRTHAASLEGWNSTIELHPLIGVRSQLSHDCLYIIPRFSGFVNSFFKKIEKFRHKREIKEKWLL